MSGTPERRASGDTRSTRLAALFVFACCAGVLGYMHRGDLWPASQTDADAGLNPEFVACRDARIATVDNMLSEGLIDEASHTQFSERAIAICADEFPIGQGGS